MKNVLAVLITHYHFDHIGALGNLLDDYNCEVIDYKSSQTQHINNFSFIILKTPGHTSNSVSYYFKNDNIMFTGDFLFKESIGRCDLDDGNYDIMLKSISKIKTYNKDIKIYPGHGDNSTLSHEFEYNVYLGENNE